MSERRSVRFGARTWRDVGISIRALVWLRSVGSQNHCSKQGHDCTVKFQDLPRNAGTVSYKYFGLHFGAMYTQCRRKEKFSFEYNLHKQNSTCRLLIPVLIITQVWKFLIQNICNFNSVWPLYGSRGSSVSIVSDYGQSGFDTRQGQRIFPLASVSRPALGPTQPPVQWVPGVKCGRGVTLTTHPHLVQRSWMSRSYISSPPQAPPWRVEGLLWPLYFKFNVN
jgi:hypothetical protein